MERLRFSSWRRNGKGLRYRGSNAYGVGVQRAGDPVIACSTLWGTVILGKDFYNLSPLEQEAVYAHEKGHIHHFHAWKRLWWMITLRAFFNTEGFFNVCAVQELEADTYAAARGHTVGLVLFLHRNPSRETPGYPTSRERLKNITC